MAEAIFSSNFFGLIVLVAGGWMFAKFAENENCRAGRVSHGKNE